MKIYVKIYVKPKRERASFCCYCSLDSYAHHPNFKSLFKTQAICCQISREAVIESEQFHTVHERLCLTASPQSLRVSFLKVLLHFTFFPLQIIQL